MSRAARLLAMPRFAVLFPTNFFFFLLSTINKIFLSAIVVRVRACPFFASFYFCSEIKSFEIEIIYRLGARSLTHTIANIAFVARIQLSALSVSFQYINLYVGLFVCSFATCVCVHVFRFCWCSFRHVRLIWDFFLTIFFTFIRFLGGSSPFLRYDRITPNGVHSHPGWLTQTTQTQQISCIIIIIWMLVCAKKILFV